MNNNVYEEVQDSSSTYAAPAPAAPAVSPRLATAKAAAAAVGKGVAVAGATAAIGVIWGFSLGAGLRLAFRYIPGGELVQPPAAPPLPTE